MKWVDNVEEAEPFRGFNKLMELNGWWWEPYGSVIEVAVETRNLIRITEGEKVLWKTHSEFLIWVRKQGYEKEDPPQP